MKVFLLGLLFISGEILAATNGYEIKIDLALNGKRISQPTILVKEGELATVDQKNSKDSSYIEVKAAEIMVADKKRIKINFTVGIVDKFGQKAVTSKHNVIVRENETTKITLDENEDNSKHLSLAVIIKRKKI